MRRAADTTIRINKRLGFNLRLCVLDRTTQQPIPLPRKRFRIELYVRDDVSFAPGVTRWSDDVDAQRLHDDYLLDLAIDRLAAARLAEGPLMCRLIVDRADARLEGGIRRVQYLIDPGVTVADGGAAFNEPVELVVPADCFPDPGNTSDPHTQAATYDEAVGVRTEPAASGSPLRKPAAAQRFAWDGTGGANYYALLPDTPLQAVGEWYRVSVTVSDFRAGAPRLHAGADCPIPPADGTYDLLCRVTDARYLAYLPLYGGDPGTERRLTLTVNSVGPAGNEPQKFIR